MCASLAQLFLETIEIGTPYDQLNAQLGHLSRQPIHRRLIAQATRRCIQIQHQRPTASRVTTIAPTRLSEQSLRFLQTAPLRRAVFPGVDHRINARFALQMTEDARRQGSHSRLASAIEENRNEFFLIQGNGERLTQKLGAALLFGRSTTDDRIKHVETHVVDRGAHRCL